MDITGGDAGRTRRIGLEIASGRGVCGAERHTIFASRTRRGLGDAVAEMTPRPPSSRASVNQRAKPSRSSSALSL